MVKKIYKIKDTKRKIKRLENSSVTFNEWNENGYVTSKETTIKFCLVVTERGKHLNPSRTQQLRPSSPMVVYARVCESRTLPSPFYLLKKELSLTLEIV